MDAGDFVIVIVAVLAIALGGWILSFFTVWLRAWLAGAHVSMLNLIAMRLRKVPCGLIVDCRIAAIKAGSNFRRISWKRIIWRKAMCRKRFRL